jgi:hypothetical protein
MTGLSWSATVMLARGVSEFHHEKMYVYGIRLASGRWHWVASSEPKRRRG